MRCLMLILSLCVMLSVVGVGVVGAEGGCQSGIAVKLGYFVPSDDDVDDIYGSGLTFGADYLHIVPWESYGIRVGIERFFRTRTIRAFGFSIDQSWLVVPITGTFVFFPTPEKNFYIGAGLGFYTVREKIEKAVKKRKEILWISSSESEMAPGFHFLGGFSYCQFFGEAKISHAVANSTNLGGLSMSVGYRLEI